MKRTSFSCFHSSFLFIILFFVFLICCGNLSTYAQTVIYKSDGNVIRATHVIKQEGTRSFQLYNDSSGVVYYLSNNSIDSIRYEDGTLEKFSSKIMLPEFESTPEKMKKNTIGFNIWPFFSSNIEIFYDRLFLNNQFGFKNCLLISTTHKNPYGSYYSTINYSISSGINYYFLQSDLFRFGTGAAFAFGQFNEEYYKYTNDYMDFNYYTRNKNHSGVFINASLTAKIQKIVFISLELDAPLFWQHTYAVPLIKTEIGINF